ncbi:amino acid ABC transporter permease [Streptomyces sp. NBRC 110028]|uniref:amino acid ABC transporter permease n=1 Tax=Streptomyces sp. NBRC 110028 TaxID=1621260 RepID=UPI0006E30034|nr:amino acid ABC transporter permease [Streptomyces sp. NBRC 110028]
MFADWTYALQDWPTYLAAAWLTLKLSLAAFAFALACALGLLGASARRSRHVLVRAPAAAYVEVIRNTPLLVQMLFIYFGAAYLNIGDISVFGAALLALTLFQGAYVAEIFRSGIEAVPRGQWEAARALGLTRAQTFGSVILPQTRAIVLPPLVGQYLSLVKDTSIAVVIGYAELLREGQAVVDRDGHPGVTYLAIAVLYFVICSPLSVVVRRMERKAVTA